MSCVSIYAPLSDMLPSVLDVFEMQIILKQKSAVVPIRVENAKLVGLPQCIQVHTGTTNKTSELAVCLCSSHVFPVCIDVVIKTPGHKSKHMCVNIGFSRALHWNYGRRFGDRAVCYESVWEFWYQSSLLFRVCYEDSRNFLFGGH